MAEKKLDLLPIIYVSLVVFKSKQITFFLNSDIRWIQSFGWGMDQVRDGPETPVAYRKPSVVI